LLRRPIDSLSDLLWQYARTVLSFSFFLSFASGVGVGAFMIESGWVTPDLSFKAITVFLLGKLPSCLVAFFLLLRLTFVAKFQTQAHASLDAQISHPLRHIAASVWVGVVGWELSIIGGALGLFSGLLLVDPNEIHPTWAYLCAEYDLMMALRGILRTVLQAVVLSWLLYLESIVMLYWESDKETRMTQFIFLGLITLIAIEVVDTVLFIN
jgi:hypothetical protein